MECKFKVILLSIMFALVFGCTKDKPVVSEEDKTTKSIEETKQTDVGSKKVKLTTNMGDIIIELNEDAAPVTVKNFLRYTKEHFYNGTIFHRVIPNFMIQGGGFSADMIKKQTNNPIINEANNGLKNERGTVAMARTNNPNSATCQFFINLKDNDSLNFAGSNKPGYAVFGKVIDGMDVIDKIASVRTANEGRLANVPVKAIVIESAEVFSGK